MENPLLIISLLVSGLAFGYFLGYYITSLKTKSNLSALLEREQQLKTSLQALESGLSRKEEEITKIAQEKEELRLELIRQEEKMNHLKEKNEEQKLEVSKLQEKFTKEFENLANKILDVKSEKFTKQNKENIENILNPLKEKIKHFEDKVDKTHKESIDYHAALRQQIFGLKELNEQMSKETLNLTKALKGDSKMQGNWGELVLERVLEKSGLKKDYEYSVQQSFTKADGTRQLPDVIINLPGGKKMIVDSKVSLTAYERYVNADEEKRPAFLKEHITSIKTHIQQLSAKKYEDIYEMESPDFVLMFVPIEPAFAVVINEDNGIYGKALEHKIVIVTPSTLLATLRTIDTMWSNDKQQRNALEIARQAGALYDKFEGFISDLTKVGKKMDDAKTEYKGAMNKLVEGRGNIITSIEKLKKMGAKAKKALPENYLERAQYDELE